MKEKRTFDLLTLGQLLLRLSPPDNDRLVRGDTFIKQVGGAELNVAVGVALGFVDVLPILGTGTVLIPWAVVCLFQRQYVTAAGLMVIYGICYFFREFAEARLMGTQLGITGLETLIAIYVGLSLFGVWGMLLGPAGYLVIREIMTMY